jgi:hypothetical protein
MESVTSRGDEAEIARARRRPVGDKTRNVVGGVQVDLLLAKAQRGAPFAKGDDLHPQHARVEFAGARDIGDSQDQMIEAFDIHIFDPFRQSARHHSRNSRAARIVSEEE